MIGAWRCDSDDDGDNKSWMVNEGDIKKEKNSRPLPLPSTL
jgi:hypothetical protein